MMGGSDAHVVPMYAPRPDGLADCWHAVRSPGGYESWYFDAEDDAQGVHVVAILMEGSVSHPEYLREYFRYLRRPTHGRTPVARDYPCASFAVYENGKLAHQFMTQVKPEAFSASAERVEVTVGENTLRSNDGALRLEMAGTPWVLTRRGPKLLADQRLVGTLAFRPLLSHPAMERVFPSRRMTGAAHRRVIATPMCKTEGAIEFRRGAEVLRSIPINGRGYHDHHYGTGPLGPGLKRWMRGRMFADGRVWTFQLAEGRGGRREVHLIVGDEASLREVNVTRVEAEWGASSLGLKYPTRLAFGGDLVLERPRLIDVSPFYVRLIYAGNSRGATGTAFCEVAYPHRLRWPVLGRMIEMSIRRE